MWKFWEFWRFSLALAGLASGLSVRWFLLENCQPARTYVSVGGQISPLEEIESIAIRELFHLALACLVIVTGGIGWVLGTRLDRSRGEGSPPGEPTTANGPHGNPGS